MQNKYFYLVIFSFLARILFAQPLELDKEGKKTDLAAHIQVLEAQPEWDIYQVMDSSFDNKFEKYQIQNNYKADSYWLKIQLKNRSEKERFFMVLEYDWVELYYKDSNGKVQSLKTGKLLEVQEKSFVLGKKNILPIELPIRKRRTFYLKISQLDKHDNQNFAQITLIPYQETLQEAQNVRLFVGVYLGILLMVFLYNGVLYAFSKDRSYLYYALFILFSALNAATVEGFMLEGVWGKMPFLDLWASNYFLLGTWLFFLLFTRRFLNLYHIQKKFFYFIQYLSYAYLFSFLLQLVGLLHDIWLVLLISVSLIVSLSIAIISFRRGYAPAYHFVLGNIFFTFGVALSILIHVNFFSANFWNIYIDQIATLFQVIFFAIGLAQRLNLQNQELAKSQEANKLLIASQREEIEQLIHLRTAELTEKNQVLERKQKKISEHNQILEEKNKQILEQKKQTEQEQRLAERAYKNLKMLKKVGTRLSATLDIEEIFQIAYRHVSVLIRDSNFGIATINEEMQQIEFIGFYKAGRERIDYPNVSLTEKNRLLVWSVQNQREVFTNNYLADYEKFTEQNLVLYKHNQDIKSLIYIPLISHEKSIGVLLVQSEKINAYEKIDAEILRNLASYVAIAIANAHAYAEIIAAKNQLSQQKKAIEDAYENIKIMQEVGEKINSTLDLKLIVEIAYKSVRKLIRASTFGIGLIDKKDINFLIYYQNGIEQQDFSVSLQEKDLLMVWCVDKQREVFVNDYEQDYEKFIGKKPDHNYHKPASLIYIPMMIQEKIMGIMLVESEEKDAFDEVHSEILRNLASYVAIGIDNAQAYSEIKTQNLKIRDSLRYAQVIQEAILPERKRLKKYFEEVFIIYKPVDMVSGDFYWLSDIGSEAVVVMADCTGHGVPGAFMSMIGNALLNEIVNQDKQTQPSRILELLHLGVKRTLQQERSQNSDGMDAAVIHIDKEKNIRWASAKMSIFYYQNQQVQELRGDRFSLGGNRQSEKKFTDQHLYLEKNDVLYLSSDGFYDQNNAQKEKFGKMRFMETLQKIALLPLDTQEELLLRNLAKHQGEQAQRDDISILGLKNLI